MARRLAPVAVIVLAGCAGGHEVETGADTGHLFARGIDQITDLYIEPISSQKLVVVGAANLARLDGRLASTFGGDAQHRNQLTLTYDGLVIASFQVAARAWRHRCPATSSPR